MRYGISTYIKTILAAALLLVAGCTVDDTDIVRLPSQGGAEGMGNDIAACCVVENSMAPLASRSLIDRITTKKMDSNFLRIDEDIDKSDHVAYQGLYTFTQYEPEYAGTVNWNKATLVEATVISSPDNTLPNPALPEGFQGGYFRSVSFDPVQTYNYISTKRDTGGGTYMIDTVQFYHTRMVGWYPRNCTLVRNGDGKAATTLFGNDRFSDVRVQMTDSDSKRRVGVRFTGLDGQTDLMVSDVCEGQCWHIDRNETPVVPVYGTNLNGDQDSVGNNIYRSPFGYNYSAPTYSNFFTYHHYLSAVRIWGYAEQSPQSMSMWGEITGVSINNQPTACEIMLPDNMREFGEVVRWYEYDNIPIAQTPMFGDDSNHADEAYSVEFPVSMAGTSPTHLIYLGYALVQPNRDVDINLHTASGDYVVKMKYENYTYTVTTTDGHGNTIETEKHTDLFKEGFIYDLRLKMNTNITVAEILTTESDIHYYDLTRLESLDLGHGTPDPSGSDNIGDDGKIAVYKYANSYIVSPETTKYETTDEDGNTIYKPYEGYAFIATVVGTGEAGILSQGAQSLYPTTATIDPVDAHILWQTESGLITDVELVYGYVRFRVPDSSKRGNAVIAVYDEDENVLWSWHIWITDTPAEQVVKVSESSTFTILDRNLGATRATASNGDEALETYGLYYQWGRKDPSMGPRSYNYASINMITATYYDYSQEPRTSAEVVQYDRPTLRNGIEKPMYLVMPTSPTSSYLFNWLYDKIDFLWGYDASTGLIHKTIYDPCPFGYRVPGSELSSLLDAGVATISTGTYGQTFTTKQGTSVSIFFPYAGYKGIDRGMNSAVCSWKYVGSKGDYQTADVSTTTGSEYMHRGRLYLSSVASWSEIGANAPSYSGNYQYSDHTNRRTAASVRCVKANTVGNIFATIDVEGVCSKGSVITLNCAGESFSSNISYYSLSAEYEYDGVETTRVIESGDVLDSNIRFEKTMTFTMPDDDAEFAKYGNKITFKLLVRNTLGVSDTAQGSVSKVVVVPVTG